MAKKKAKTMKNFLAVYLGSETSMRKWDKLPKKTRDQREKEGMAAWHAWAKKHGGSIVEAGAPLGTTKRVDKRGVSKTRNELAAFTIVKAPSHAAAAKMFVGHPHFMIFPGESIEVMECLEIPGM